MPSMLQEPPLKKALCLVVVLHWSAASHRWKQWSLRMRTRKWVSINTSLSWQYGLPQDGDVSSFYCILSKTLYDYHSTHDVGFPLRVQTTVMLILVLVLKDSLRTNFKSLSLWYSPCEVLIFDWHIATNVVLYTLYWSWLLTVLFCISMFFEDI